VNRVGDSQLIGDLTRALDVGRACIVVPFLTFSRLSSPSRLANRLPRGTTRSDDRATLACDVALWEVKRKRRAKFPLGRERNAKQGSSSSRCIAGSIPLTRTNLRTATRVNREKTTENSLAPRSVISTREFGSALRRGELRPEEASLLLAAASSPFLSPSSRARAISVRRFSLARALPRVSAYPSRMAAHLNLNALSDPSNLAPPHTDEIN